MLTGHLGTSDIESGVGGNSIMGDKSGKVKGVVGCCEVAIVADE